MYKTVALAVDGSEESTHAGTVAAQLGMLKGSAVHLVSAVEEDPVVERGRSQLNDEERERLRSSHELELAGPARDALAALKDTDLDIAGVELQEGPPATAISEAARKIGADLVVMGRRGLGAIQRFFLGSVSLKVLELCDRPVLVVPGDFTPGDATRQVIVAPTDFSAESRSGLTHARDLAVLLGAKLVLTYDVQPGVTADDLLDSSDRTELEAKMVDKASARLKEIAGELAKDGLEIKTIVATSEVAGGIVAVARQQEATLICMASHGRSGLEKMWLGSFTQAVVKRSHVPVLVVRTRG